MPNTLLTINMITREAVRLWKNSNAFIQNIDSQYDDQYAQTGAKIGTSLRIRLPNDFTVRTGPAVQVQDTTEQSTTMVLATQKGVDVSFSSVDRTMSLDDYSRRILAPSINNLAGAVAADIMSGVEGGICNFVSKVDGGGNIITPDASTYLRANAILNNNSAPLGNRKVVNSPFTEAAVVSSLSGLFNPTKDISRQYSTGTMQQALGWDWFMDQTVIRHVTGSFTAGTVSVGGQANTSVINTNAITGQLNVGDIVTIDGVNAVNRITKTSVGALRQFVITAIALTGAISINVYPALVPAVGGQPVQYQTVDASPLANAAIRLVNKANEVYTKNIGYAPECVTMATADLELPKNMQEAARESYDGISMRMVTGYNISTDQMITRLDILYGYLFVRPEWGVAIADTSL